MRSRGLALFACAACAVWPAVAGATVGTEVTGIDARLKACMAKDDSNSGMGACTQTAEAAADKLLQSVYGSIVKDLKGAKPGRDGADNREKLKRLVAAERAWMAFRGADCALQGTEMLGGSGEGLAIVSCLFATTKQRVKSLDELFNAR